MKKTNKNYLNKEDLYAELLKWKESNPDISLRVPSEKLGSMFILMCDHMLRMGQFNRYAQAVKDDMKAFALYKCIRGLKTFKFEDGEAKCFNYFTRAIYTAFLTEIGKYYKQMNIKRELQKHHLESLYSINPNLANQRMKENEYEV